MGGVASADERDQILRDLWESIRGFTAENVRNYPAAARAIDAGAASDDLVVAMTVAAYEATFETLYQLTGERDLADLTGSGAGEMLHEDLLSADPTGREGADLFC